MTNDLRILNRDLHKKMTIQEELREELLAIKFANKKQQEEHYAEMQNMELTLEREENPCRR